MHQRLLLAGLMMLIGLVASGAEPLSRTNLLQYTRPNGTIAPVRSTRDWTKRRAEILAAMESVMGRLHLPPKRPTPTVEVKEEVDCGDYVRRLINYQTETNGVPVPAYLLVPKVALKGRDRFPAVLALHQTHPAGNKVVVGLGQSPDDEYGVELVRRGYVVLAPAYPLLADYAPDLKALGYESGTMKAIHDNMRGLDMLESLPFVRPGRFGAIGHSLGGHNALFTAAFDERIRAVATSCAFDSFRDYKDGNISGWTSERYMPRLKQFAPDRYPFDFAEVLAAIAPRAIFISAPLGDTNFKAASVDRMVALARPVFRIYSANHRFQVEHPETGHSFPKAMRDKAYATFDANLR